MKKQEKYNSTKKKENHCMFPPLKITGTILADVSVFSVHRQYVCLLSIIMYKLFYLLIHLLGLIPLSGQYSTILGHCTDFHLRKIYKFSTLLNIYCLNTLVFMNNIVANRMVYYFYKLCWI